MWKERSYIFCHRRIYITSLETSLGVIEIKCYNKNVNKFDLTIGSLNKQTTLGSFHFDDIEKAKKFAINYVIEKAEETLKELK